MYVVPPPCAWRIPAARSRLRWDAGRRRARRAPVNLDAVVDRELDLPLAHGRALFITVWMGSPTLSFPIHDRNGTSDGHVGPAASASSLPA